MSDFSKRHFIEPIPKLPVPETLKFWSHVNIAGPSDCWAWLGGWKRNLCGYFVHDKRQLMAVRVAYALANGDPGRRVVAHTCKNSQCCNPAHLKLR